MQALKTEAPGIVRPDRLNYAGWCIWCGERYCTKARCVKMHVESIWGPCSVCGGSQMLDVKGADELCGICIGGLTQYDSVEDAVEQERRETEARRRLARHLSVVPEPVYVVSDPSRWRPAADHDRSDVPAPSVRSASGQVFYAGF
ncbi:hypothetical protein [Nocardia terpenica]|uniref:Uncharacterized protein n=1 Tax=Nocardia terpenica TaxID=455432 RepID=A0A164IQX6_9NOCA|nr:hypothetical protein [Nocardia terpenica]KZM69672.1 hypothetical protein AWN90_07825 [Nocardia terpenica]NQE89304.1 hypothetical protein [Nocardia terpenica]